MLGYARVSPGRPGQACRFANGGLAAEGPAMRPGCLRRGGVAGARGVYRHGGIDSAVNGRRGIDATRVLTRSRRGTGQSAGGTGRTRRGLIGLGVGRAGLGLAHALAFGVHVGVAGGDDSRPACVAAPGAHGVAARGRWSDEGCARRRVRRMYGSARRSSLPPRSGAAAARPKGPGRRVSRSVRRHRRRSRTAASRDAAFLTQAAAARPRPALAWSRAAGARWRRPGT